VGLDAARIAWRAMVSNRLRSGLTILGVVIGVAAVVSLVSVSGGASGRMLELVEGLGANTIQVVGMGPAGPRFEDVDELLGRSPVLSAGAPVTSRQGEARLGDRSASVTLEGTTPPYREIRDLALASGRFLTDTDVQERARVAVLGHEVAKELFWGTDPLGHHVFIGGASFTVVGVMEEMGASLGRNDDYAVWIPVSTARGLLGIEQPSSLIFQASSRDVTPLAVNHIEGIYNARYGDSSSVRVQSQAQLLETVDTAARTASMLLGSIAGISLVVGGIGIMNIMLVSVTERTREIGIRKAVGARRVDILLQFLVESSLLSLSGGALGAALGALSSQVIGRFAGWDPAPSLTAVIVALAFAIGVGLTFGIYPAYKASQLDPAQALRIN